MPFLCCHRSMATAVVIDPTEKEFKLRLNEATPRPTSLRDITPLSRAQLFGFICDHSNIRNQSLRISSKGVITLSDQKVNNPLKNYEFIKKIGEGDFGEVSRHRHKTGTIYDIKTCVLTHETFNEIRAFIAIGNSERAINLKKIIIDKEHVYFIMEYLQNMVSNSEQQSALNRDDHVFQDAGITLRDRWPRNMMKRADGRIVQIDYGLLADFDCDRTLRRLQNIAEGEENSVYQPTDPGTHCDDDDSANHLEMQYY